MRAIGLLFLVSAVCLGDAGDVIKYIDAPAGEPDGLEWVNGSLYITSDQSHKIYQISPADGAIISSFDAPGSGASLTGLAYDGTYLWSCRPPSIYKLNLPGGSVASTIPSPSPSSSEGLAWLAPNLRNANSSSDVIYELDPATGAILSYFTPSGADGTLGLAYDGTYLWASFMNSMLIYRMIPGDPVPVQFFLAPSESPQDICWDGQYLWMTEYLPSARVYQIDPGWVGLQAGTWGEVKTSF
jgi:hypothetical protein